MSLGDTTTTTAILRPARRAVWRYVGGLLPVILLWGALAGWLAWQLVDRSRWPDEADRAAMTEWLEESRTFRKSLAELVKESHALKKQGEFTDEHRREMQEQLKAMVEPTRMYANQLPSFPEVYSIAIRFPDETLVWTTPVPRPKNKKPSGIKDLNYHPVSDDPSTVIHCEFHLHALNRMQQKEEDRRQTALVAGVLLITATALAVLFVRRFWKREHAREVDRLTALADAEHRERELLAARLDKEEAERKLENTEHEHRTQLYAGIGIMAGSYAHNIKNLLVRPNDLLARTLETDTLTPRQQEMIDEVRSTLGTVTERLQQILHTVRRDPNQSHVAPVDLAKLARDTATEWSATASEKWKVTLTANADTPAMIQGDLSHLQQALENLIFNGRDATFELRNHLRDDARREPADELRKQKLLAAAAWKGEVTLSVQLRDDRVILAVSDNGIGMTDDVKANCLKTHFTTKRDNALYEGYTAGMGLGLSFVAMVVEHHTAELAIETVSRDGTTFTLRFPRLVPNPVPR